MSDPNAKLSHQYIASLIEYCSQVGCITGAGLLKQIELDAEAYPWLFQDYHGSLIVSYAKLGLLGHSRRCHREGIKALHGGAASDMDWSLCVALLRSFRQKEAHAIFNNLVATGQANSTMYGKMIKEYTLVQLPDVAFALFDDACRTGLRPDYSMLCELATASALFTDSLKSSACIQKVITCLANWRIPAGIRFFICILKGYDLSHQNVLFDSLARKLVHRLQYTNNELNYVLMVNAARRGDLELAHILAPQVMESLSKFPRNEVVLRKIYQPEKRRELLNLERFPENNFTANMKLSLEIDASSRSLKPKSLLHNDLVAAHQMLDFLRTLPCDYNRLPYSPLIRYYIARGMLDDAHKLITSVVQHDIPIDSVVIKMYCQVLLENAETADCGNFLRYIHRTDRIASVPYSVFEIFVLHCVKKRRIADIEWVVEVLVNSPGETTGVWRAILKRLGKSSNIQDVANIVKMAIDLATDKGRAGMHLLSAAVDVPLALVVADNVLNVLGKHLGDRSTHLYSAAFSIFARLWVRYHTLAKADGRHFHESKESLVLVLERHIYEAAALGIDRELLGITLRALASNSRNMDLQEYIKILESVPNRNYSIGLLESICVGFARRGRTRDVDVILELMWNQTIMLDISVLNNLMSSINCMPIPRGLFMLNKSGINIGRADIKAAEFNQTAMVEDGDNERIYNRGLGEEKNRGEDVLLPGIVDSIEQPAEDVNDLYLTFYKENLARILSIWRRFEFYSTSPDIASYSILLGAYTKAKEYQQGEDLVSTVISMFGHELHISCQWITLRLKRGNVKGALHIFDALGNSDKCNELSRIDKRYMGLHYIERSAFHFFPFVKYYLGLGKHTLATRFLLAMHTLGFKGTTRMYCYILMHAAALNNRQLVVDIVHQMVEFDVPINAQLTEIIRSYSELLKHKNTTSGSLY
ncbi:hypothetical protein LPJ72_003052 [Coemansia sp. Benny D160-2]|nr:hypothetical protein LPJ72_003052 [Coemansia sp. Benny D160-2]